MPYEGTWIVATNHVIVTEDTVLSGLTPELGLLAYVQGQTGPSGITADSIEVGVPSFEFEGYISSFPADPYIGNWVVGSRTFPVTGATEILGLTPEVGLNARVVGRDMLGTIVVDSITVLAYYKPVAFEGVIQTLP